MIQLADRQAGRQGALARQPKTNGVYPMNMTPLVEDGYMYGVDQHGQLRCVKMETGERRVGDLRARSTQAERAAGTAFIVKNGDRFFIFTEKGDLIIAKLSPEGYEEMSRAKLLEPTTTPFGRDVVWSHPAFADRCVFARNDKEIVCVSLEK